MAPRTVGVPGIEPQSFGTHICHFYESPEELLRVLVPFFRAGLESNERCLWVVSDLVGVPRARDALAREVEDLEAREAVGQLELWDVHSWYEQTGDLDPPDVTTRWTERARNAVADGYEGLRISGDTAWLRRDQWADFMNYEAMVTEAFRNEPILAVCAYSLSHCNTKQVLEVFGLHHLALVPCGEAHGAGETNGAVDAVRSRMFEGTREELTEERELRQALERAKDDLRNLNETLEERVRERTAELERRYDQLRQMTLDLTRAEQRERRKLARMLHDEHQQVLTAVKMLVERIEKGKATPTETAAHASEMLDEAIEKARTLSYELSPAALHHSGLPAALREMVPRKHERYGLTVHLQADEDADPTNEDVRVLLFQFAREVLFNVAKHAETDEAWVTLTRDSQDRTQLVVEDRGRGFGPGELDGEATPSSGQGLSGMRERLWAVGGEVEIDTGVGRGTRIALRIPRETTLGAESPAPQSGYRDR